MLPLPAFSALLLIAAPGFLRSVSAQETPALASALTFHASFDHGLDADFSVSEKSARLRSGGGFVPAAFNEDVVHQPAGGRYGGGLLFPRKGKTRPQFHAPAILGYNGADWSATVSVWLRLDPDRDLEPGYCDPVQITGDDTKKGFIFMEWSKNESPRLFRFAIRPLLELWNPANTAWDELPAERRPMVQVANAPFSRAAWTHAVFSFEHLNSRAAKPVGRLHLNGKLAGSIEGWDLRFGWNPDSVELVLGASYVGAMDDLAVFNRALSDREISALHVLPGGAGALHAGRR